MSLGYSAIFHRKFNHRGQYLFTVKTMLRYSKLDSSKMWSWDIATVQSNIICLTKKYALTLKSARKFIELIYYRLNDYAKLEQMGTYLLNCNNLLKPALTDYFRWDFRPLTTTTEFICTVSYWQAWMKKTLIPKFNFYFKFSLTLIIRCIPMYLID